MALLLGLLTPLVLYGLIVRSGQRRSPSAVALLCALLALVVTGVTIGRLGPGTRPLQIAWTGIEQHAATQPLTIGGTRDAAVVGWPNGANEPRLQMQKTPSSVSLDVTGGLAFLIDTNSGRYVNGVPLQLGSSVQTGPYTVRNGRAFPGFWRQRITIEDAAGRVVSTYAVTTGPGNRGRFATLRNIDGEIKDPIFREYAQSVLLSVDATGELHLLDTNSAAQADCVFPCRLLARWRNSAVRLEITDSGADVLSVAFQRPWRYTSPMPPAEGQQRHVLVVTGDAEPGDHAFLLPIGGAIGSLRHYVHIDRAGGNPKFVTGQVQPHDDGKTALIPAGSHRFRVSLTEDGLRVGRLLTLLALCVLPFAAASATVAVLDAKRAEAICVIALAGWTLLLVRVLLAVRYALSPAHLDQMGISGLASSMFGLAVVPALILLAARIRHDVTSRLRRFGPLFLTLAVTVAVTALQMWMVPAVWRDLPALLIPPMCRPWFIGASALLGLLFTALAVLGAHVSRGPFQLLAIPNYYSAATHVAGGFWNALNAGTGRKIAVVIVSVAALGVLFFGLVPFVLSLLPAQKLAQEVIFPLLFLWLAVILWTASTANSTGTSKRVRVLLVVWMVAVFLFPWFMFPFAMRDAGNLYATTAVFLPLALLLLPFRGSRFAGVTVLLMFFAVVVFSVVFYLNIDAIYRLNRFYLRDVSGAATTRLLVFKKGLELRTDTAGQTHSLRNAVQHVWENQAMARRGGLTGRGFGEAPVRRSRIPQEVLQFDSIHSFYITGDFGLIGGLSTILAYLFPLFFLLGVAARHGLTRGLLFAILVTSAFALEGIAHAAMNLGALPFSGRSAPLLAATSGSDLLKWGVLLLIAGTAVFDSTTITPTLGRLRGVAVLALLLPVGLAAWTATRAVTVASAKSLDDPFTWAPALRALQEDVRAGRLRVVESGGNYRIDGGTKVSSVDLSWLQEEVDYFNSLPPAMKLDPPAAAVALAQATRVRDLATYDQWLCESTQQRVPAGLRKESIFRLVDTDVTYDEAGEISNPSAPAKGVEINFRTDSPYSFARDNRRPEDIPTISLRGPAENLWMIQGGDWAVTVPSVQARPMSSRSILLRPQAGSLVLARDPAPELPNGSIAVWLTNSRTRRPFEKRTLDFDLFNGNLRISNPPGGFRDFRVVRDGQPRQIAPGTAFVLAQGDVIEIAMPVEFTASIITRKTSPIIGPAWINGHWRAASNDSGIVPWSHELAQAIESEWERLGPAAAASRYADLTLDSSLQRSSQTNASREGRQLHASKIGRRSSSATSILPPRAAFAALALPSGEVLAIGGWPRMSAQRFGERGAGREWLPGYDWVDRDAPRQIRVRYDSDRNFDLLLMGSSTKPVFAAAALKIHPMLDQLLRVQPSPGEGDREPHVFGFDIVDPKKGWKVSPSGIVDFTRYLAISDNRYHVRLGFLALAEADGNRFAHTGQHSRSIEELVGVNNQGQPLIWHRYPRFPPGLAFSNVNTRKIANLDQTPFAAGLRTMFGIAAKPGDFGSHRLSFWTGDGAHDAFAPGNDMPSSALRGVSPRIANLNLLALDGPRAWVSTLLGGESNRWSNVDFAAGFATAVTGRQTIAHITGQQTIRVAPERESFPGIARKIRPGLEASVSDSKGTAHLLARNTDAAQLRDCGNPALARLQQAVPGLRVYAKTGTLSSSGLRAHTTSRIALALIRWANEAEGLVDRGMVVSIVLEEASPGTATCVANRYLNENADAIIRTLAR